MMPELRCQRSKPSSQKRERDLRSWVQLFASCLSYVVLAFSIGQSDQQVSADFQGKPLSRQSSVAEIDIASYFPIRQGDVWTYEWSYRIGSGPMRTVTRTRAFEGREFVNAGFASRLVSENGDYVLFSLDDQGLYLHGAAEYERGIRFLFDPPIGVLTKGMKMGQPLVMTQLEEDGQHRRTITTMLEGIESVETPMGKFSDCLKVWWEMEGSTARQKTTYYFAKGIGIVAYQVEARSKKDNQVELSVDARLKLAQLGGRNIRA